MADAGALRCRAAEAGSGPGAATTTSPESGGCGFAPLGSARAPAVRRAGGLAEASAALRGSALSSCSGSAPVAPAPRPLPLAETLLPPASGLLAGGLALPLLLPLLRHRACAAAAHFLLSVPPPCAARALPLRPARPLRLRRLLALLLLLALGALPAARAITCPSACSCVGSSADCSGKALTAVPAGIDPLTTSLCVVCVCRWGEGVGSLSPAAIREV